VLKCGDDFTLRGASQNALGLEIEIHEIHQNLLNKQIPPSATKGLNTISVLSKNWL